MATAANFGKTASGPFSETYAEASKPGEAAIMSMVVNKACTGKEAVKMVTCNALLVTPAAAGGAEGGE